MTYVGFKIVQSILQCRFYSCLARKYSFNYSRYHDISDCDECSKQGIHLVHESSNKGLSQAQSFSRIRVNYQLTFLSLEYLPNSVKSSLVQMLSSPPYLYCLVLTPRWQIYLPSGANDTQPVTTLGEPRMGKNNESIGGLHLATEACASKSHMGHL